MPIKLGATNFGNIYLGSTQIVKAYVGSTKVYDKYPQQTTVTIGGKTYPTVTIGDQTWMAVNLDFYDSDIISHFYTSDSHAGIGGYSSGCMYLNYDGTTNGWNGNKYGMLYNATAVSQLSHYNLANGWDVPTQSDFLTLFNTLGGITHAGLKLKSTSGWANGGNGDGSTAFNALPAGFAVINGADAVIFNSANQSTGFWSRTSGDLSTTKKAYTLSYSSDAAELCTTEAYYYSVRLIYKG